jgi:hypothetical protein
MLGLNWIRRGLGKAKGWDEQAVIRTIHPASLVQYWQAVSGKVAAWEYIAALVEDARIAEDSRSHSLTVRFTSSGRGNAHAPQ